MSQRGISPLNGNNASQTSNNDVLTFPKQKNEKVFSSNIRKDMTRTNTENNLITTRNLFDKKNADNQPQSNLLKYQRRSNKSTSHSNNRSRPRSKNFTKSTVDLNHDKEEKQ